MIAPEDTGLAIEALLDKGYAAEEIADHLAETTGLARSSAAAAVADAIARRAGGSSIVEV